MKALIAFLELTQTILLMLMQFVLIVFAGIVAMIGAFTWKK